MTLRAARPLALGRAQDLCRGLAAPFPCRFGVGNTRHSPATTCCRSVVNHFHSSHVEDELSDMQSLLHDSSDEDTLAGHSHTTRRGGTHRVHITPAVQRHHQHNLHHHQHAHHKRDHSQDDWWRHGTSKADGDDDPSHGVSTASLHRVEDSGSPRAGGHSAHQDGVSAPVVFMSARSDPVDVMAELRRHLPAGIPIVLVLADSRAPGLLLSAMSILHLLNQDLRLEEEHTVSVFFQPMSEPPPGIAAAAVATGGSSAATARGMLALLVRRIHAPDLLRQLPSATLSAEAMCASSEAASPSASVMSEVWDMARAMEAKLSAWALILLKCAGPRGLVTGMRALRRVRKAMHGGAGGPSDVLIAPHITTDHGVPTICLNVWHVRQDGTGGIAAVGHQRELVGHKPFDG